MSGQLRVATIVTRFMAGAGGVALRGALALDPSRYAVTIVAGSGGSLLDQAAAAGLEVVTLDELVPQISPRQDRAALNRLGGLLSAGRYDVVHTHSAKAGALGRMAAAKVGVPLVVHTFHGFPFHEFQSRPRRSSYVAVERWLGRLTDAFLAVGAGVAAEAVRRRLAAPERIRTIAAAVDAGPRPSSPAARAAARRLLDVPPGMKVVGSVGRLDYQKAPEDFVEALAALGRDDVLGIWVGEGPLRTQVARLAGRRGLAGRIRLLGHRSDVAELLPGFDVFAMASRYEGLPCAIVEAMASGVPVVATAVNAVPDVVVPGETGLLVPPQRPALLAAGIGHLLDNQREARRMAGTAQARLGDRFAPETLGDVLAETYATSRRGRPQGAAGSTWMRWA